MAPIPRIPLFGGSGDLPPTRLDLPQAVVTADDAADVMLPDYDNDRTEAADELAPAPVDRPIKVGPFAAETVRPAPGGKIIHAEARSFVTLTEAPYPRHEWVGVPIGAPTAAQGHAMAIYASAANVAQIVAERGQVAAGYAVPTAPIVIPASGCWIRVTADATVHVLVFGY